jgi:predicted RNase H-like HicB family nuclease
MKLDFQVLVYPEDDWWIAHCLEMDLPAEGNTPDEAIQNLLDIARVQVEDALKHQNLTSIFSAAPAELWRQFAFGKQKRSQARVHSPFNRLSVRELAITGGGRG